jgi:hypothetical protein
MSGDGRLDLDDLGEVIDGATTLDEVVGEEHPTTWGERLESAGVTPWVRRHRVVVAGVAAAVVAVGAVAWVRTTRPPDDGLAHGGRRLIVDTAQSIEGSSPIRGQHTPCQRPDETLLLLGITIGRPRSTGGRAMQDSRTGRTPPQSCFCRMRRPRVCGHPDDTPEGRRTDAYGRTVDTSEPLPLGSRGGGTSPSAATACGRWPVGVHVDHARELDPTSNQVALDLGCATPGVDLARRRQLPTQVRPSRPP